MLICVFAERTGHFVDFVMRWFQSGIHNGCFLLKMTLHLGSVSSPLKRIDDRRQINISDYCNCRKYGCFMRYYMFHIKEKKSYYVLHSHNFETFKV